MEVSLPPGCHYSRPHLPPPLRSHPHRHSRLKICRRSEHRTPLQNASVPPPLAALASSTAPCVRGSSIGIHRRRTNPSVPLQRIHARLLGHLDRCLSICCLTFVCDQEICLYLPLFPRLLPQHLRPTIQPIVSLAICLYRVHRLAGPGPVHFHLHLAEVFRRLLPPRSHPGSCCASSPS